MAAADSSDMWSRAARIESFKQPLKKQKKRTSTQPKKTLTARWPHETPTAEQLARAGFYFHFSNDEDVDSTRCFTCGLKLDGWEAEDDPVKEHIAHIKGSERCAWATCLSVIRAEGEEPEARDPLSEELLTARKETFGDRWPHEGKRAWKCKVDRMAEAGWSYDPSPEDIDGVICHYCGLELSGFEPKDDPFIEHRRRKESCRYFELIDFYHDGKLPKKKRAKTAKSRSSAASKASRASMRSVASTAFSERADHDDGETDILAVDDAESVAASQPETKPKKTTKAKASKSAKPRKQAASQVTQVDAEDADEPIQKPKKTKKASQAAKPTKKGSIIASRESAASAQLQAELEDSILEGSPNYWVNPERESFESMRGTKRRSDGSVKSDQLSDAALDFPMPPVKQEPKQKKARTAKTSTAKHVASTASQTGANLQIEPEDDEVAITQELARIEAEETAKLGKQKTKPKKQSQAIQVLEDEAEHEAAAVKDRESKQFANLTPSPSGSDKENNPSSLNSAPVEPAEKAMYMSPTKTSRIPLAHATPNRPSPYKAVGSVSPSKRQLGMMKTSVPWQPIDIDTVLLSPTQNTPGKLRESLAQAAGIVSQAERDMTVESWIKWRAGMSEDELKRKCEEMVGKFEREGNTALECLHGLNITA